MYIPTELDDRLAEIMMTAEAPSLLLLSGSAGGGKSALIRKLEGAIPAGTFSLVIEDATHAEAPNEDQMRTLAEALSGFRGGLPPSGQRILLAANTGLMLRLERAFRGAGETELAELAAFALHRLGVTAAPPVSARREAELEREVLVVDLDQRPTSGNEKRLLRSMLAALAPDSRNGIFKGADRCRSCTVSAYCAPRTNLELLSDPDLGAVIDKAVENVALNRGRDIPPRLLWDGLGELAMGGIEVPEGTDPCETIATIASARDHGAVWSALLPNGPLASGGASQLCQDLAVLDPSLQPSPEAHDIIARSGIDPESDAQMLMAVLNPAGRGRHAVITAADYLRGEHPLDQVARTSRGLVRAAWLAGRLPLLSDVPRAFIRALDGDDDAVNQLLQTVANGLVKAFGRHSEGSDYLPTESLAESRRSRILVRVELLGSLDLEESRPLRDNPKGSHIVGMRPLSARLKVGTASLDLDLALFRLLEKSSEGALAASLDIERFHSLRHAVEILGRSAAENPNLPLLIVRSGDSNTYRASMVPWRGEDQLRIMRVS
ncbi:hypothetical protein [Nonomuraea dietziae]|uniref:hypothetical protein n=1 Tax=Nonomuraea dietziae TaxID=65515 RepID=UPI00340370E2